MAWAGAGCATAVGCCRGPGGAGGFETQRGECACQGGWLPRASQAGGAGCGSFGRAAGEAVGIGRQGQDRLA